MNPTPIKCQCCSTPAAIIAAVDDYGRSLILDRYPDPSGYYRLRRGTGTKPLALFSPLPDEARRPLYSEHKAVA